MFVYCYVMKGMLRVAGITLTATAATAVVGAAAAPAPDASQVASPSENFRVTVLTPRLLRVQWRSSQAAAAGAKWHDLPTTAVVNRDARSFSENNEGVTLHYSDSFDQDTGKYTLETSGAVLELNVTAGSASYEDGVVGLTVKNAVGKKAEASWTPKAAYAGNMLGTIRTLDTLETPPLDCAVWQSKHDTQSHCSYGVLSRAGSSGVAAIDDSGMPVYAGYSSSVAAAAAAVAESDDPQQARLEALAKRNQPAKNPTNYAQASTKSWNPLNFHTRSEDNGAKDVYLFAYGTAAGSSTGNTDNYKRALKAFRDLSGAAPAPQKYAFGVWFTRWYGFDDEEIRSQIGEFEKDRLPLDVNVWDMNWHSFGELILIKLMLCRPRLSTR